MGHMSQGECVPRGWDADMEKAEARSCTLPDIDSASRWGPLGRRLRDRGLGIGEFRCWSTDNSPCMITFGSVGPSTGGCGRFAPSWES